MRYIIVATAIALMAGITLGFVVSRGLDGSASAAPPTQAVEEQNLDGSGSIAVHEQGVADVNVTNTSLPVNGTVDVGNLPALQDVNVTNASLPVSGTVNVGNLPAVQDVNVVSVTSGLMEYTHLYIKVQDLGSVEAPPTGSIDLDAELTALGALGWKIDSTESWFHNGVARVLYTLTRPAP